MMQKRLFYAFKGVTSASTRAIRTPQFSSSRARQGLLKKEDILSLSSTPHMSPSYPPGPYHFTDREYFIIAYESDMDKIQRVIPAPLKPKSNVVLYEWINMDSTGLGFYKESGTVIPCVLPNGEEVNYTLQMFLDCESAIAAGREVYGFPKVSVTCILFT
jgi:acetoacetate decarboxylase